MRPEPEAYELRLVKGGHQSRQFGGHDVIETSDKVAQNVI